MNPITRLGGEPVAPPLPISVVPPAKAETADDDGGRDLPPVVQFPVAERVTATLTEAGRHPPLPFPDSDE